MSKQHTLCPRPLVVLGVDPAFRNTGWARALLDPVSLDVEIEKVGILFTRPPKDKPTQAGKDRVNVQELTRGIMAALKGVAVICAEGPAGSKSARSARTGGLAWATLCACAEIAQIPIAEATPQRLKKALTGANSGTKAEIRDAALRLMSWRKGAFDDIPPRVSDAKREHIYDAAAAVYALRHEETVKALCRQRVL